MFPITLDEMEDAFRSGNFEPMGEVWSSADLRKCDPLTAVILARHGVEALRRVLSSSYPFPIVAKMLGLSTGAVIAFTSGFDGSAPGRSTDPEHSLAWGAGVSARERFLMA